MDRVEFRQRAVLAAFESLLPICVEREPHELKKLVKLSVDLGTLLARQMKFETLETCEISQEGDK